MKEESAISIVVRTFNSEKTLPRLLSRLDLQPGDEVVVVDSGSGDQTVKVAESWRCRVMKAPPPFNYSKSLNIGFRAAGNRWVLALSSHSIPMIPNLLEVFRAALAVLPSDVVVGYGTNQIDRRPCPDKKIRCCTALDLQKEIASHGNSNALYRRAAWEALPFDENIRTGEDHLWLKAVVAQGSRFALIPGARTLNCNAYSLAYMFRKGFSDSRAGEGRPMRVIELGLNFGSAIKRVFFSGMPLGNGIRFVAHGLGCFFGSRAEHHNRPC